MEEILIINPDGSMEFIYSDKLRDLVEQGTPIITRVSNVEPDENGDWVATMWNGVKLGPYYFRETALTMEVEYINREILQCEPHKNESS